MSTVLSNMNIHADENDAQKLKNVKKVGGDVKAEMPKRAALGDLQNRVLPRVGIKDQGVVKNSKEAKLPSLRSTKARVDTHWRKDVSENAPKNNAAKTTSTAIASTKPAPTAAQPAVKVGTRSSTLRSAVTKTSGTGATTTGIQRQKAIPNQTREIKTVITKLVENKLQKVEVIKTDQPIVVVKQLRREDSNISRKSFTKLKAALAQEAKIATAKAPSHAAVQTKKEDKKDYVRTLVKVEQIESYSTARIDDVRNIDEGDNEMLILVSEYVNDIYDYLFHLEIEHPIHEDHLGDQQAVTPKMRAVLLDWINEVHSQFHLVIETFHMTVGIIDRYLQEVKDTKRSNLQLVGVTALFIAAKYEELYPPVMADFIYMTDHSYNQQQILEMEIKIFRSLDCNLSRPVSIHFLRRFSKAADIEDFQHAMSKYFLELAAIDYELASYKPSEIAAASLFLSLHMSKDDPKKASGFNDSHWNPTLEHYSHYTAEHLRPITRKIATIARHAREAKLNAVYTKYQSSKLYKASLRPVLYSALMDSLIEKNV